MAVLLLLAAVASALAAEVRTITRVFLRENFFLPFSSSLPLLPILPLSGLRQASAS